MDKIHIRDLTVRCIVGTEPKERIASQNVVLNITLDCDLSRAAGSDDIDDTVNYRTIKDRIVEHVEKSTHLLIERLASEVADLCLEDGNVVSVTVIAEKPDALTGARSVGVELQRGQ